VAYFNTAAVGLASRALLAAYRSYLDKWAANGLDYVRGETAGESARTSVAAMIGADRSDVALIASVSAAAGLVAAQFGPARPGQNVVIASLTDGLAFRQLDQLARRDRRSGSSLRVRGLRCGCHPRPEPRVDGQAQGVSCRCRLGADRPTRG